MATATSTPRQRLICCRPRDILRDMIIVLFFCQWCYTEKNRSKIHFTVAEVRRERDLC